MKKQFKILIITAIVLVLIAEGVFVYFQFFYNRKSGTQIESLGNDKYQFYVDDVFHVYDMDETATETREEIRIRIYGEFTNKEKSNAGSDELLTKLYCDVDGYDIEGLQYSRPLNMFTESVNTRLDMNTKLEIYVSDPWKTGTENVTYFVLVDENLEDIVVIICDDNRWIYLTNKAE